MAFQFPANPTTGDIFTAAPGVQYRWTGVAWCPFATQFPGVPIFQNPALFADGTMSLPGIAWANEPNSGFTRTGAETFRSMVTGKNVFSWNKGGFWFEPEVPVYLQATTTFSGDARCNATLYTNDTYMGRNKTLYARNMADTAWWPLVHAGGDDCIHIGWNGYPTTHIYGGGGIKLSVHGGGVNVAGILNAPRVDGNLNGTANLLRNHGDFNQSQTFNFHWQDVGARDYYWGSSDGWNMYVVHRNSMSVSYADSCNQANRVGGAGGWNYANWDNNPTYVWATNGDGNTQFLAHRPSLSVNYANSTNMATYAQNGSGRFLCHHDGWGGGNPDSAWYSMPMLSETGGGAYPGIGMHRQGNIANVILIYYDNSMWFGSSNNSGQGYIAPWASKLDGNGNWHAAGYSRTNGLLRDAEPLTGERALAGVLKLRGVRGYNIDGSLTLAVMPEGIEDAFPETVTRSAAKEDDGTLGGTSFDYGLLIAPVIEAIRELAERVDKLENAA